MVVSSARSIPFVAPTLREETASEARKYAAFFASELTARDKEREQLQQRPRMNRNDRLQAAYLTGRDVDGRPVSDALLDMLMRGNEGRTEAIDLLPLGRANVDRDIKATRRENVAVVNAMREVVGKTPPGKFSSSAEEAAVAISMGTGRCGEFASVVSATVAGRLKEGEKLTRVRSTRIEHGFVLLSGKGGCVKVDGWGEGPAIDSVDGALSRRRRDYTKIARLEASEAPAFLQRFQDGFQTAVRLKPRIDALVPAKRLEPIREETLWPATPMIDKAFAQRVRHRIDGVPPTESAGWAALSKKGIALKHRCLSKLGFSGKVQARSLEKLSRHAPPPLPTRQEVREMAIRNARRMGFEESEAIRNADMVVDLARNLTRPERRELRVPPADLAAGRMFGGA